MESETEVTRVSLFFRHWQRQPTSQRVSRTRSMGRVVSSSVVKELLGYPRYASYRMS
jgi:hypothetical protein